MPGAVRGQWRERGAVPRPRQPAAFVIGRSRGIHPSRFRAVARLRALGRPVRLAERARRVQHVAVAEWNARPSRLAESVCQLGP